ncbi:MAG: hypothetical protein GIX03_06440 [Candidatus Eremiobacteraeota bacterium]|nr:hypothetical protein [Candidatus Eremiobacteraeota bacterium]MBC5802635.1 hypothetical protein [Candidatus Eremiobacteraeota bacterium]MBC5820963.1 hypothetical protein [Candidatus Eremiobacteraeota bacterium]
MSAPRRYRMALSIVLAIALLAALYVAAARVRKEQEARRVEIAMDYGDFVSLAQSYGYDQQQFLIALRRAGLTSLAVSEELGGAINASAAAVAIPGQQLLDQARLGTISQPTLAAMARGRRIMPSDIYLVVYDPREVARYRTALAEHLGGRAVRVLRPASPTIFAITSQIDYFDSLGLGLPAQPLALARTLHLLLVPRVQNDERFGPAQIDRIFASFKRHERPSTVVFFGARNEVLGFPDNLQATADAFIRTGLNFGSIETYDQNQVQKGNDGLAEKAIARTTRVQAISKTELDKLDFNTVVARYLLGVRERNVRVVYLRPFLHEQNGMSLERTNVELVRDIASGLMARGFTLGRATPVPGFRINPLVIVLVSLAVPAIVMLLFEAFGVRRAPLAYAVFALDVVFLIAGYASHHDLLARKVLALAGAIGFATMSVVAIPRAFTLPAPESYGASLLAGLRTLGIALAFALAGGLVVVGLVSTPVMMEEIDRFTGVKAVILVPPLLAFALYVYTRRFGGPAVRGKDSALAPVRAYQLAIVALLGIGAFVYVSRSGNQSDVSPTGVELALRSHLTAVLGVRPRFKEFAIGFPLMLLLPALRLEHKRVVGWVFAIGIAIGTADVVDTFSHLHTPLAVSLTRVFNGAVIGVVLGAVAIGIYRAVEHRAHAYVERRRARAA